MPMTCFRSDINTLFHVWLKGMMYRRSPGIEHEGEPACNSGWNVSCVRTSADHPARDCNKSKT